MDRRRYNHRVGVLWIIVGAVVVTAFMVFAFSLTSQPTATSETAPMYLYAVVEKPPPLVSVSEREIDEIMNRISRIDRPVRLDAMEQLESLGPAAAKPVVDSFLASGHSDAALMAALRVVGAPALPYLFDAATKIKDPSELERIALVLQKLTYRDPDLTQPDSRDESGREAVQQTIDKCKTWWIAHEPIVRLVRKKPGSVVSLAYSLRSDDIGTEPITVTVTNESKDLALVLNTLWCVTPGVEMVLEPRWRRVTGSVPGQTDPFAVRSTEYSTILMPGKSAEGTVVVKALRDTREPLRFALSFAPVTMDDLKTDAVLIPEAPGSGHEWGQHPDGVFLAAYARGIASARMAYQKGMFEEVTFRTAQTVRAPELDEKAARERAGVKPKWSTWYIHARMWVFGTREETVLVPVKGKPIRLIDGIAPTLFDYADTCDAAGAESFRMMIHVPEDANLNLDPMRSQIGGHQKGWISMRTTSDLLVEDLVKLSSSPDADQVGGVGPRDISTGFEMPQRYPRGW